MDHFLLATDRLWILNIEQVRFLLLLVVVLDQASSAVNHLVETVYEALAHLMEIDLRGELGTAATAYLC